MTSDQNPSPLAKTRRNRPSGINLLNLIHGQCPVSSDFLFLISALGFREMPRAHAALLTFRFLSSDFKHRHRAFEKSPECMPLFRFFEFSISDFDVGLSKKSLERTPLASIFRCSDFRFCLAPLDRLMGGEIESRSSDGGLLWVIFSCISIEGLHA